MFLVLRGVRKIQSFPKLGTRGGRQISNFSQIQKSPNYPRGGGVKKIVDFFPLFGTSFNLMAPLTPILPQNSLKNQILSCRRDTSIEARSRHRKNIWHMRFFRINTNMFQQAQLRLCKLGLGISPLI